MSASEKVPAVADPVKSADSRHGEDAALLADLDRQRLRAAIGDGAFEAELGLSSRAAAAAGGVRTGLV